MMTKTNRRRLYLYASVEDYEEGDASKSVLVTGELDLGRTLSDFFEKNPRSEAFVVEVVSDPRF